MAILFNALRRGCRGSSELKWSRADLNSLAESARQGDKDAVRLLVLRFDDAQGEIKAAAAESFEKAGGRGDEQLLEVVTALLRHPNPKWRRATFFAFAQVAHENDIGAVNLVLQGVTDEHAEVRIAALSTFASVARWTDHPDEKLRNEWRRSRRGWFHKLLARFKDNDSGVTNAAFETFAKLLEPGDRDAIALIIGDHLMSRSCQTRVVASKLLRVFILKQDEDGLAWTVESLMTAIRILSDCWQDVELDVRCSLMEPLVTVALLECACAEEAVGELVGVFDEDLQSHLFDLENKGYDVSCQCDRLRATRRNIGGGPFALKRERQLQLFDREQRLCQLREEERALNQRSTDVWANTCALVAVLSKMVREGDLSDVGHLHGRCWADLHYVVERVLRSLDKNNKKGYSHEKEAQSYQTLLRIVQNHLP